MKSSADPRHQTRRRAIKELFAQSYTKQPQTTDLTQKILGNIKIIDAKIKQAAPTWPVDKLNKIDLAILRLAIFELMEKATPPKVVIDEAVELAKEYGSENSSGFINGVLGTILEDFKQQ